MVNGPSFESWMDESEENLWEEYVEDQEDGLTNTSFRSFCEERFDDINQFEMADVLFDQIGDR